MAGVGPWWDSRHGGTLYVLAGVVYRWCGTAFPYGTLADQKFLLGPEARLFWMVGLLGAFTTFSSLIYESWRLMQDGEILLASTNLVGSVVLGLLALWAGHLVASWL